MSDRDNSQNRSQNYWQRQEEKINEARTTRTNYQITVDSPLFDLVTELIKEKAKEEREEPEWLKERRLEVIRQAHEENQRMIQLYQERMMEREREEKRKDDEIIDKKWNEELKKADDNVSRALAGVANEFKKQDHDCLFQDPEEVCRYQFNSYTDALNYAKYLERQNLPFRELYPDTVVWKIKKEGDKKPDIFDYQDWKEKNDRRTKWDSEIKKTGDNLYQGLANIANSLQKQEHDCFTDAGGEGEAGDGKEEICQYNFKRGDARNYQEYLQNRGIPSSLCYEDTVLWRKLDDKNQSPPACYESGTWQKNKRR
jgi:hypothetical protein